MLQLGASGSGSLMRVQSVQLPALHKSELLKLDWSWQSKVAPHTAFGRRPQYPVNLLIGLFACPHSMAAGFPQTKRKNEKAGAVPFLI